MRSKYSIAVLPFVNMSSDKENEYFSDGVTEEIINSLSKIDGIHVIARTSSFSFKNINIDVREVGKKLNVSNILEGSIRMAGNIIRITAQLVRSDDGFHIWSESWDRKMEDIFIIQDEIAALIAKKINKEADVFHNQDGHLVKSRDAIEHYLKGKYLQNKWDQSFKDSIIQHYEKALALDPEFSQAYVSLTEMYTWMSSIGAIEPHVAYPKIQSYIAKLLEIDPHLPETQRIISNSSLWMEWDFEKALNSINTALAGKPSYPDALIQKGLIYAALGNVEMALDHLFQAERLNPYSESVNYTIGMIYHFTGDFEKSLEFIDKNIEINPRWDAQYYTKVQTLCSLKRFDEARDTIQSYVEISTDGFLRTELEGYYYAYQKDFSKVKEIINKIENRSAGNPIDIVFLSQMHLLSGDHDKALYYLESGLKKRVSPFLFLKIDHLWDKLRDNERFQQITQPSIKKEDLTSKTKNNHAKYRKTNISEKKAKHVLNKLGQIMQDQKLYLNPTLTLYDLSEFLNVSNNHLSQILNEFHKTNFYDYVNGFRLKAFFELNKQKQYAHYTLLALAYECGFNSKSTFNSFFKKKTGTTPSEYLKRQN